MMNVNLFGNPRGRDENLQNFFDLHDSKFHNKNQSQSAILYPRITVGSPGSGKSFNLKRQLEYASKSQNVFAEFIENESPPADEIRELHQQLSKQNRNISHTWKRIWYCAILTSVASHIINNKDWHTEKNSSIVENIKNLISQEFSLRTVRVLQVMGKIIRQHSKTVNQLINYINHEKWSNLEHEIIEATKNLDPIYVFIDSQDVWYARYPTQWMKFQEGLYYCVYEYFLENNSFQEKIRPYISIREHVFSSILQDQADRARILSDPYIHRLSWNYQSIQQFIRTKIMALDENFLAIPEEIESDPFLAFFGHSEYENHVRSVTEPVSQYVLRHTRMVPVDVVTLGNRLCQKMSQNQNAKPRLTIQDIKRTTRELSRGIGITLRNNCVNHLRSKHPEFERNNSWETTSNLFSQIVKSVGHDRFSWLELKRAITENTLINEYHEVVEGLPDILWQNRILGYVQNEKKPEHVCFYLNDELFQFDIPKSKSQYVFHPSLVDCYDIKADQSHPAIPLPPTIS